MTQHNPVTRPMEAGLKLFPIEAATSPDTRTADATREYQSIIGGLMFAVLCTRPDIAFSVTALSQFNSNPGDVHMQAVKRVLRYLRGTPHYGITYVGQGSASTQPALTGFCDSDYGNGVVEHRRSVSGYAFTLSGGAISWWTKKQKTVATSTVEAEYMATTAASKEAIWWRAYMRGLGYDTIEPTVIYSDSQGSIALAKNPDHHSRTKHIDIQYHFIRHHIDQRTIVLKYISTLSNLADVLTKALVRVKHETMVKMFGVHPV